jgi:hypothetical protein
MKRLVTVAAHSGPVEAELRGGRNQYLDFKTRLSGVTGRVVSNVPMITCS